MPLLPQDNQDDGSGPSGRLRQDARRWRTLAWAAALMWAILVLINWSALTHRAALQTESLLDFAMLDLDSTLNGSIDTMLMRAADSIVAQLGVPKALDPDAMSLIARQRGIDEVNIVGRNGTILASSDRRLVGIDMSDSPRSAEFLVLTNGERHAFSHPFRAGAHNPDVRRKYVGVAFPGGNGFVQVGIDEDHVTGMFPSIMGFIFDEWLLGENGFFLCADLADGHLISNPAHHRDHASFLSETGYDPGDPAVREDAKTTFRLQIFGDICDCRAVIFCGHRLIAALPTAEYYSTRTFCVWFVAVAMAAVLALVVLLVRRIDISAERLQSFYDAENERRAKDMGIAKTIQSAALPGALPASPSYLLDAAMMSAKDVGGDFYDYFTLDSSHVAFLIADVSGKGITAALYMMTAKTLIKDTLLAVRDPAAALTKANSELCANNPANMFLTAWVGVLDIDSGEVAYANAGHNPPLLVESPCRRIPGSPDRQPAEASEGVSFVHEKSGPVLAFMDGIQYKPLSLRLAPGDALFLYTDGVTEALDGKGVLFGEERLANTLASIADPNPHMLCSVVRMAVAAFAEGVQQADDITVLAIRRAEASGALSRSFPPSREGIASASEFLDEAMLGKPEGKLAAAHIILDEICSNIVKHSGASGFEVEVEFKENPSVARMTFIDDGVAYDPLAHADPDTTLSAEERPIGGLGLLMVKKMSSSVSYRRDNNRNCFAVELSL